MKIVPRGPMHSNGVSMLLGATRPMLSFQRPPARTEAVRSSRPQTRSSKTGSIRGSRSPAIVKHTPNRYFVQSRRAITQERFDVIGKLALAFGADVIAAPYRLAGEQGRRAPLLPLPKVLVVRLREREGVSSELHGPVIAAAVRQAAPRLQEVPEKSKYLDGFRYYLFANGCEVNADQLRARPLRRTACIRSFD